MKHEIGKIKRTWFELMSPARSLFPGGCWRDKPRLAPQHLSSCTANSLTTWALELATLKLTRGNYPQKNSLCRLQCRCEKFHRRLTWWTNSNGQRILSESFYGNFHSELIANISSQFINSSRTESVFLFSSKDNTQHITTQVYTLIFILYIYSSSAW